MSRILEVRRWWFVAACLLNAVMWGRIDGLAAFLGWVAAAGMGLSCEALADGQASARRRADGAEAELHVMRERERLNLDKEIKKVFEMNRTRSVEPWR